MHQALLLGTCISVAVLGRNGFTALTVALLTSALVRTGLPRSEAIVSAALAGFLIYAVVLIMGFGVGRLSVILTGLLTACGAVYGLLLLAR